MLNPSNTSQNLAIDTKGVETLRQSARQNSPEALKESAKQFEALFMNMIMKSMREASPQDGMFDNEQTKMYTSMLDQQLSQNFANRGVGLADMLVKQLSSTLNKQVVPGAGTTQDLTQGLIQGLSQNQGPAGTGQVNSNPQTRQHNPWKSSALEPAGSATGASKSASSQPSHVQSFQERVGAYAEEASQTTGIPAKYMLGQAALESGWGKREIRGTDGTASNNLFGIKATASWKGKTVDAVTTEYVNGVPQKRIEKFRAYDSYADAFRDYANLLRKNPRYQDVLANATDVNSFAQGLQRAGYATDPNYASKLTRIITHNLSA